MEVTFPLLEEIDLAELNEPLIEKEAQRPASPPPVPPATPSEEKKEIELSSKKSKTSKSSSKVITKGSKGGKGKNKEPGPYDAADENEMDMRLQIRNPSFKTERSTWAKVMQFPEDAIAVETSEVDLVKVRDTFRSCVEVKVVYLKVKIIVSIPVVLTVCFKTMIPTKGKKGKGKGKEKKNGGKAKGKKGKGNKSEDGNKKSKKKVEEEIREPVKEEQQPEKPPEEIILKKITLAKFKCDLHSINWSDRTIDYYWAQHQEVGSDAIPVEGSLRVVFLTKTLHICLNVILGCQLRGR